MEELPSLKTFQDEAVGYEVSAGNTRACGPPASGGLFLWIQSCDGLGWEVRSLGVNTARTGGVCLREAQHLSKPRFLHL